MQRFELSETGQVAPGEAFEIAAPTMLATGMRTTIEAPAEVIVLASENAPAPAFGGAGETIYRFQCKRAGDYTIRFKQGRPWETKEYVRGVTIRCRPI